MQPRRGHRADDIQQHGDGGIRDARAASLRTSYVTRFRVLPQAPEFDWAPETIGVVDSSFFWGYLITQVPGGFLASKYAANKYNTFPCSRFISE